MAGVARAFAVTAAAMLLAACAPPPPAIAISVRALSAGGITIDEGADSVTWSCNVSKDDPTLCRGRADRRSTVLRFFAAPPVTFANGTLMLYRSGNRIIALQLEPPGSDIASLTAAWGPLIQDRYATSAVEGRPCRSNTAARAMFMAEAFFNSTDASICADEGEMQIDWRFALEPGYGPEKRRRLLALTIVTPGLPGRRSWWLS